VDAALFRATAGLTRGGAAEKVRRKVTASWEAVAALHELLCAAPIAVQREAANAIANVSADGAAARARRLCPS
jgi:hypothetical protein